MPQVLKRFRQKYPGVEVTLSSAARGAAGAHA
jgi:DNA-binding transcriptional LysR family regulator